MCTHIHTHDNNCNEHSKKKSSYVCKNNFGRIPTTSKADLITITQWHYSLNITRSNPRPHCAQLTVYKQRPRTMFCSAHQDRHHLDLSCDWRVSPKILTLSSETSVREWTWPSAKIPWTGEQPWGEGLRTIVRNSECKLCVMTLSIIKQFYFILTVCIYVLAQLSASAWLRGWRGRVWSTSCISAFTDRSCKTKSLDTSRSWRLKLQSLEFIPLSVAGSCFPEAGSRGFHAWSRSLGLREL